MTNKEITSKIVLAGSLKEDPAKVKLLYFPQEFLFLFRGSLGRTVSLFTGRFVVLSESYAISIIGVV